VQGAERNINDSALSRLSLPLIGQGEVYYQGKKIASSKVLEELNWQPIKLSSLEAKALTSGTHFLSAYAMCALKKTEQLLKIGDAIAALSFDACNYTIPPGDTSIKSGINKKGQKSSASTIYEYLNDIKSPSQKKEIEQQPYSFTSTPQIHDAAKETFNYVLTVFLEEINSVSENLLILPEENVVLERSNTSAQSLLVALDMLSISMTAFASISERRINRLARDNKAIAALPFMAESIVMENKQLSVPASLNYISFGDVEDFVSMGASAATKCLQVINNAEKVLALELLSVVSARQSKRPGQTSLFLEQLLAEVQSKIPLTNSEAISNEEVIKAVEFIQLHKLV
jgi:histidine ammonia-lyase